MAEKCECSRELEFKHLQDSVTEIKATAKEDAKERSKEMLNLLESKIRTELALEDIVKTQVAHNAIQIEMMSGIQAIKDEPFIKWKKLNWVWKAAAIGAAVNYVFGNAMGWLKALKIIG